MSLTKPNSGDPGYSGATKASTILGAIVDDINARPISVKQAAYGAVGDGSADDTTALQNAINDAASAGAGLWFPPGTYKHTALTGASNVALSGPTGATSATLLYSGTGARALDFRDTNRVIFQNLQLQYSSSSFTGTLVDFSKNAATPFLNLIRGCSVGGSSSSAKNALLFDVSGSTTSTIEFSSFGYCDIAVKGYDTVNPATTLTIRDCQTLAGGAQTVWLQDFYQGCLVERVVFEPITGNAPGAYRDSSLTQTQSLAFIDCWMGDNSNGVAGSWISVKQFLALVVLGGRISVANAATGIKLNNNSTQGLVVQGVFFNGAAGGTAIDYAATGGHSRHVIMGNGYSGGVTLVGGTIPLHQQSIIDNGTALRANPHQVFALTDGATVSVNCTSGTYFTLSAGGSRTIAAPTNPVSGMPIIFDVLNNTAGAITTTWNATYKMAGAWVDPAAGKRRKITFSYDGTNWLEDARTAADI